MKEGFEDRKEGFEDRKEGFEDRKEDFEDMKEDFEDEDYSKFTSIRLQILHRTLYDHNVTMSNIKEMCKAFHLEEVVNQGREFVCSFLACSECISYHYALQHPSLPSIRLSARHAIDSFRGVVEKFMIDDSVPPKKKRIFVSMKQMIRYGPSIAQTFTFIKRDGVFDGWDDYPYKVDKNGLKEPKVVDVDLSKLVKYTIGKSRITEHLKIATDWLEKGPIVGSMYTPDDSKINEYKGSIKDMFTHGPDFDPQKETEFAHTVLIIGKAVLKIEGEVVPCFLVKNSFKNWGENGFAMIARDQFYIFGRPEDVKLST